MKILENIFHPDIEASSVNAAWAHILQKSGKFTINMPYSRYHDWNIDIEREQELLLSHDRIVFQHPFFWYSTPPLMKKWMDDVLTMGWAYGPNGDALNGKEWISAISTGVKANDYRAGGGQNFSISEFLKPIQQTANLIGMKYLPPYLFHDAVAPTELRLLQSSQAYLAHIIDD